MLRFKQLQGEEEVYLARLARRAQDPHVRMLVNDVVKLRTSLAVAAQGARDAFEKVDAGTEGGSCAGCIREDVAGIGEKAA